MAKVFIPFHGETPAHIEINGHRLLILSTEESEIEEELFKVGGTEIREIDLGENEGETLVALGTCVNAGVVLPPPGMSVTSLIRNLEEQLPWIH